MNMASSRSHSIFTLVLEQHKRDPQSGEVRHLRSKLNLVDLAGRCIGGEGVGREGGEGSWGGGWRVSILRHGGGVNVGSVVFGFSAVVMRM